MSFEQTFSMTLHPTSSMTEDDCRGAIYATSLSHDYLVMFQWSGNEWIGDDGSVLPHGEFTARHTHWMRLM